jgi:putative transcriptional regulator
MTAKRDIGTEVLDAIRDIEAGRGRRFEIEADVDPRAIRERLQVSQRAFAALVGVSVRTLQDWEQRRRRPRGPALALLRIVARHPEVLTAQGRG